MYRNSAGGRAFFQLLPSERGLHQEGFAAREGERGFGSDKCQWTRRAHESGLTRKCGRAAATRALPDVCGQITALFFTSFDCPGGPEATNSPEGLATWQGSSVVRIRWPPTRIVAASQVGFAFIYLRGITHRVTRTQSCSQAGSGGGWVQSRVCDINRGGFVRGVGV